MFDEPSASPAFDGPMPIRHVVDPNVEPCTYSQFNGATRRSLQAAAIRQPQAWLVVDACSKAIETEVQDAQSTE
jgi:hypothetical protein